MARLATLAVSSLAVVVALLCILPSFNAQEAGLTLFDEDASMGSFLSVAETATVADDKVPKQTGPKGQGQQNGQGQRKEQGKAKEKGKAKKGKGNNNSNKEGNTVGKNAGKGNKSKGGKGKGKDGKGKDGEEKDGKGKKGKGKDEKGKDEKGKDEKGKDEKGKDKKGKDGKQTVGAPKDSSASLKKQLKSAEKKAAKLEKHIKNNSKIPSIKAQSEKELKETKAKIEKLKEDLAYAKKYEKQVENDAAKTAKKLQKEGLKAIKKKEKQAESATKALEAKEDLNRLEEKKLNAEQKYFDNLQNADDKLESLSSISNAQDLKTAVDGILSSVEASEEGRNSDVKGLNGWAEKKAAEADAEADFF